MSKTKLNKTIQYYRGIPLQLIARKDYEHKKAKRFTINGTNQNVWIPNKHLQKDGTITEGESLMYVFKASQRQLELAGISYKDVVQYNKIQ